MKNIFLAIVIIIGFASCQKSMPAKPTTTQSQVLMIRLQVVEQGGNSGYSPIVIVNP